MLLICYNLVGLVCDQHVPHDKCLSIGICKKVRHMETLTFISVS